ncbi:carbohydrate porin [Reyranella sp.]|uniref:carbohydrate porin n=1 Tax=Reyranella sp. TaxID=1929291 RepID=UPI003BA9C366
MNRKGLFAFGLAAILAAAAPASAEINPWIQSELYNPSKWDSAGPQTDTHWLHPGALKFGQKWGWFSGNLQSPNVTGSWGGLRDRLELQGVAFSSALVGQFAANPAGGQIPGKASWLNDWSFGMFVDFRRVLGSAYRTYFTASFDVTTGSPSLTPSYVGNFFPVQLSNSTYPQSQPRLVHAAFGTQLFDNTSELAFGRMITGEDFAFISRACTSLNQAICANPIAGARDISFPTYPNAVWGGRFKVKPGERWYAHAGAYLVYPTLGDPALHGVEFGAPDGSGVLAIGEAGFNVGTRAGVTGLPGTYKAGFYYDTETLTNLSTGANQRSTWGMYAIGEQMIYSANDSHSKGLWTWLSLSYAPPDVNEVTFMAAGGLSYVGLLPSRPNDTLSVVGAVGRFSEYLSSQGSEVVIELNYRAQILPSVFVQPDIQYIVNPDGKFTIADALVIGFAVGVTF